MTGKWKEREGTGVQYRFRQESSGLVPEGRSRRVVVCSAPVSGEAAQGYEDIKWPLTDRWYILHPWLQETNGVGVKCDHLAILAVKGTKTNTSPNARSRECIHTHLLY